LLLEGASEYEEEEYWVLMFYMGSRCSVLSESRIGVGNEFAAKFAESRLGPRRSTAREEDSRYGFKNFRRQENPLNLKDNVLENRKGRW
jgi:hypothetical protein